MAYAYSEMGVNDDVHDVLAFSLSFFREVLLGSKTMEVLKISQ